MKHWTRQAGSAFKDVEVLVVDPRADAYVLFRDMKGIGIACMYVCMCVRVYKTIYAISCTLEVIRYLTPEAT